MERNKGIVEKKEGKKPENEAKRFARIRSAFSRFGSRIKYEGLALAFGVGVALSACGGENKNNNNTGDDGLLLNKETICKPINMRDYSEEVVMNKNDTAVFGGITLKWLGETKFDIICDGVTVMANAISEDPVPGQAFEVLIRIDIIGPDQAKIAAQVRTCRIEQGMSGQVYEIDMTAWEEEDNASRKIRGTSYSLGFYGTAPDKMSMKVFCNEDFPIWRSNISEGNTKNIEVKQCDAKLEVKISNLTLEEEGGRVHVSGTAIVTGPELQ